MSIDDILICAIVKNKKELDIYRMPLNEAARKHLSSIYDKEIERYLRMSSIEYDPIYKLDECELFKVSGYRLPDSCLESLNNTASLEKYTKKCGEICALLITDNEKNCIAFQKIDKSQILKKGQFIQLLNNNYSLNDAPGIVLKNHVDFIYHNEKILFRTYSTANGLLNLEEYVSIATEENIKEFTAHPSISLKNPAIFNKRISQKFRRYIYLIQESKVLDRDVSEIKRIADSRNVQLELDGNKIVIPETNKEIKILFSLLTEKIYVGDFSHDTYISNSSKKLK